jgi:hypothetical protein
MSIGSVLFADCIVSIPEACWELRYRLTLVEAYGVGHAALRRSKWKATAGVSFVRHRYWHPILYDLPDHLLDDMISEVSMALPDPQ